MVLAPAPAQPRPGRAQVLRPFRPATNVTKPIDPAAPPPDRFWHGPMPHRVAPPTRAAAHRAADAELRHNRQEVAALAGGRGSDDPVQTVVQELDRLMESGKEN